MMNKLVNLIKWANSLMAKFPHMLLALMARIFVGMVFLKSGRLKFEDWFVLKSKTFSLFETLYSGVPLPPVMAAYMAAYAEVILSFCLIIGFASRLSALGLLGITATIQIFVFPESYSVHGLWAVALLYVVKYGPCAISVDYFVKKQFANK